MPVHKLNPTLTTLLAIILLPLVFFAGLVAFLIFAVFFILTGAFFFLKVHLRSKTSSKQRIESFHGNTYDHHH